MVLLYKSNFTVGLDKGAAGLELGRRNWNEGGRNGRKE
jgi:hypothetical protein